MIESIDNLDEAKILGYFETVVGTFLTKFILLTSSTKIKEGNRVISASKISGEVLAEVEKIFPDEKIFFKALRMENWELHTNLMEDILTSGLSNSWSVFEQIIKDIPTPNYSHETDDFSVDYKRRSFGFTDREKDSLDLFYYIRNATQHHNGAYYASKEIDIWYNGVRFQSQGHIGEKIILSLSTLYKIMKDLEILTCKAWTSYKTIKTRNSSGPAV